MSNSTDNLVFSFLQEHPSAVAGTATFLIAFALVAGNAFYSQSGVHPDPIWATRDMTKTHSISSGEFIPPVRKVNTRLITPRSIPVPVSREAGLLQRSAKWGSGASGEAWDRETVRQVQSALSGTGHFKGKVDGLYGPVTKSAIIAFQRQNGLPETGEPVESLVRLINSDGPTAVARSQNAGSLDHLIEKATSEIEPQVFPKYDRDLVVKVQTALSNYGEAKIQVDGIFGTQTVEAIKRFQSKFNLTVDGIPGPRLMRKLADVGALSEV